MSFRYVDTTASGRERPSSAIASAARRRFLLLFDKSFTDPAGLRRAQRAAARLRADAAWPSPTSRRSRPSTSTTASAWWPTSPTIARCSPRDRHARRARASRASATPSALAADLNVTDLPAADRHRGDDDARPCSTTCCTVMVRPHAGRGAAGVPAERREAAPAASTRSPEALQRRRGAQADPLLLGGLRRPAADRGAGAPSRRTTADAVVARPSLGSRRPARYGDSSLRRDPGRGHAAPRRRRHRRPLDRRDRPRLRPLAGPDRGERGHGRATRRTASRSTTWPWRPGGRLFKDANDLGPPLAEMLEMTSRYYVLGIQPEHEKGAGRLPQAQGEGGPQGREALPPAGLLRAQRGPGADAAAAPVRPRGARGHRRRQANDVPFTALCLPVPGARAKRRRSGSCSRCPAGRCPGRPASPWRSRSTATRWPRTGPCATTSPRSSGSTRRGRTREGRARGVSLFGTLPVPPGRYTIRLMVREAASGRSARALPRRHGAALRRPHGLRAAAAGGRRGRPLAQAGDGAREGGPDERRGAVPGRRPALRPAHQLRGAARARASGWC